MISFILNLPYTLLGIALAISLEPQSVYFATNPYRIVFKVKRDSFGLGYTKGWRGMTCGHTILLNPRVESKDLEHEVIHVKQYERFPLIFPFLYYWELFRRGYRNNKYEEEAYVGAGNIYRAGKAKIL